MSSGSIFGSGKWGKTGIGGQNVLLLMVLDSSNVAVPGFNIKLI
jgi:hypothetical protein